MHASTNDDDSYPTLKHPERPGENQFLQKRNYRAVTAIKDVTTGGWTEKCPYRGPHEKSQNQNDRGKTKM